MIAQQIDGSVAQTRTSTAAVGVFVSARVDNLNSGR